MAHMQKGNKVALSITLAAILGWLVSKALPLLIEYLANWVYVTGGILAGLVLSFAIFNLLPPSPKED